MKSINGEETRYRPGKELSGKVRKKLKKSGSTRYSDGALKSWINNYARYMYMNNKPRDEIRSFRAEVEYVINISRRMPWSTIEDDKIHKIVFKYPKKEE